MIAATILLAGILVVLVRFWHKQKLNVRANSSIHLLHMLRRTRLEYRTTVNWEDCSHWEQPWIEPYEKFIDSSIVFLEQCIRHNVYSISELDKYIGENASKLVSDRDKKFAEVINHELPFVPLPTKNPFPEQLNAIEKIVNSAISYGNRLGNPFSCFVRDYVSLSEQIANTKMKFGTSFGMSHHSSTAESN